MEEQKVTVKGNVNPQIGKKTEFWVEAEPHNNPSRAA